MANVRVKLKRVTINNPWVFRKKSTIDDGPEKYRANFTMDPSTKEGKKNIAAIKEAMNEACQDVFGKDFEDIRFKEDRVSLFDGNDVQNSEGDVYDGYADMMVLRAVNGKRPKVVDRDGETPLQEEDDKIYGGAIVNAHVDIWATKEKKFGGNGVFATLMGVQFVEEGERFGGGGAPVEFDDEDDEDDAPKSKKSKRHVDDDEDDAPKSRNKKRRPSDDEDEDDEAPRSKKSKRFVDDDEDEDEPKSRKSKKSHRDEDDEDDDV